MLKNPSVQCYSDNWKNAVLSYLIPLRFLYCALLPDRTLFCFSSTETIFSLNVFKAYLDS